MNENQMNENQMNITWDDLATPIPENLPVAQPIIDPNGWHWYPDANGQLFTLYFDADGNECMMWGLRHDDSYYWRCANVGYICRDIGIEDRRGIFFENQLVGTMLLDINLSVTWLPETYIIDNDINIDYNINNNYNEINQINYNFTEVNDISDLDEDDNNDE